MTRFDRLAGWYDSMEAVLAGKKLARCRSAFDEQLTGIRHALLVGEGHGKFLATLLHRNPGIEITCIDASAKMLERARRRLHMERLPSRQVTLVHADILSWHAPSGSYDFIATQFFLDCFTEQQLGKLIPHLAAMSSDHALWMICDFQIPDRGLPRLRAKAIHWLMYRFFRLVTNLPATRLCRPNDFLRTSGFVRQDHLEFDWGLLYSDLWKRADKVISL